jgi:hypothetical protein
MIKWIGVGEIIFPGRAGGFVGKVGFQKGRGKGRFGEKTCFLSETTFSKILRWTGIKIKKTPRKFSYEKKEGLRRTNKSI